MSGKAVEFKKVQFTGPNDPRLHGSAGHGHGMPSTTEGWVLEPVASSPESGLPSSQVFGGANGGEVRKSFHGLPPGFAQVIASPQKFQITPMQIDTWNRDKMSVTGSPFVAGPLPRSSLAPVNATYSGLLECPVTTRIQKVLNEQYFVQSHNTCPRPVADLADCLTAAKALLPNQQFHVRSVADPAQPTGCTLLADGTTMSVTFNNLTTAVPCSAHATQFSGNSIGTLVQVAIRIDSAVGTVNITLTGPEKVWFGVGFNATKMADSPWTVVVDGLGAVTERKLGDHVPGAVLPASVTVQSISTHNGTRTVVLSRPLKGKSSDYYSFDPSVATLTFINAVGATSDFSYHANKAPAGLIVFPESSSISVAGACVCALPLPPFGQGKGKLVYIPTTQPEDKGTGTIQWDNECLPQPRSDLLAMQNPTCDLRTYMGGQIACHHMFSLLDHDQPIPWVDQPLEYSLKFRFWVQEYDPSYHVSVFRDTWGIASPVEYDVPLCGPDVMGCQQEQDGTWVHTIAGTFSGHGALVHAAFHCHAPTCLSVALYMCPPGTHECNATTGQLLCEEVPVFGTDKMDTQPFNELDFILQPPCLWGATEFGLESPVSVTGMVLGAVKRSNATYAHHGEMAWLQMYLS